jgi:protein subunit release factor B
MLGRPKWTVSVTHIPSGIVVTRDSNHYRSQHLAKEEAIKYLKSRLAYTYKGSEWNKAPFTQEDIKWTYLFPDDVTYPRNASDYRREVE